MTAPTAFWFVLSALFFCAHAGEVTLQWDAITDPSVAGVKIYYGQAPRVYTNSIAVAVASPATVTNLGPGTFYFAATTFDTNGNESDFSNEAAFTLSPGTAPAPVLTLRTADGYTLSPGTNAAPEMARSAAFTVWTTTNLNGPWLPAATIYAPAASQMFFKTSLTPPK